MSQEFPIERNNNKLLQERKNQILKELSHVIAERYAIRHKRNTITSLLYAYDGVIYDSLQNIVAIQKMHLYQPAVLDDLVIKFPQLTGIVERIKLVAEKIKKHWENPPRNPTEKQLQEFSKLTGEVEQISNYIHNRSASLNDKDEELARKDKDLALQSKSLSVELARIDGGEKFSSKEWLAVIRLTEKLGYQYYINRKRKT